MALAFENANMPQINKEYHKCGEILISLKMNQEIFTLNCFFCGKICTELENFIQHIKNMHQEKLTSLIAEEYMEFQEDYTNIKTEHIEEDVVLQKLNEQQENIEDPLIDKADVCDVAEEQNADKNQSNQSSDNESYIDFDCMDNIKDESHAEQFDADSDYKQQNKSTDVVDIFTEDQKDFLTILIEFYKEESILWNQTELRPKNHKKRERAYQNIADKINKKLNLNWTWKKICDNINKLRSKYRNELKYFKQAEIKNEIYTPVLWYYEKLSFLTESVQWKKRRAKGWKEVKGEIALPMTNINDDQNIQLIEIYKSLPCLWNAQHIGFRFRKQKQEALEEMRKKIEIDMNIILTLYDVQKIIARIRYACTQEKQNQIRCIKAKNDYKPNCKFYNYITFLLDDVGPFKCIYCEDIFNTSDQYKLHKTKHDGLNPFICPLCNRGFMQASNYTVHLRRHTHNLPYKCDICDKFYATSTDRNVHMRCHTGEKPYFCEICGQSFRTNSFFARHIRRHQKRPNHKCTICSRAFYEKNKLVDHMNAHLNVRDKICKTCGKSFTSLKYLRQHEQIHAEKKKYVCKICAKEFAQYAGLRGHMKSHGTSITGIISDDVH